MRVYKRVDSCIEVVQVFTAALKDITLEARMLWIALYYLGYEWYTSQHCVCLASCHSEVCSSDYQS